MKLKRKQPVPPPERRLKAADIIGAAEELDEKRPFNPDAEISRQDWQGIKEEFAEAKPRSITDTVEMIIAIDTIAPHMKEFVGITQEDEEKVEDEVRRLIEGIRKGWAVELTPGRELLATMISNQEIGSFQEFERLAKVSKQRLTTCRSTKNWYSLANVLKWLVVTPPEMNEGIEVTGEDLEGMRVGLAEWREQGEWYVFIRQAFNMTVLSADKVEINDDYRIDLRLKPSTQLKAPEPLPPRPALP